MSFVQLSLTLPDVLCQRIRLSRRWASSGLQWASLVFAALSSVRPWQDGSRSLRVPLRSRVAEPRDGAVASETALFLKGYVYPIRAISGGDRCSGVRGDGASSGDLVRGLDDRSQCDLTKSSMESGYGWALNVV